jgi:phospholipid/cholesterol/gamma-HCH transport system substrate-binding protein
MSFFKAGLLGIIVIVVFTYLGFNKFALPFQHHFTVHAVFQSANGLRPDSLVRIAGVNVGKVTGISLVDKNQKGVDGGQAADVSMQIEDAGLPIHRDATFAIRPRIFLEGNFFVDISPGSPSARSVPDGYTFPVQAGSVPVQVDQVLGVLKADTRLNLQILLREYGSAIAQAAPSYNASIQYWLPAYKYSSVVSHDLLGIRPHDLSNYIGQMAVVSAALDAHPQNLQSLITDFNTTANAFARQNVALENTVADLPVTLAAAVPALNALNASFPPLRTFARALDPGVRSSGPAIDASLPFITQLQLLVRPQELQGLSADLAVTVPALANLTQETIPFMRNGVRPASSCVQNVVLPWSRLTIKDSHFNSSNGFPPRAAYIEAVDFLPGLAGESRNIDANGPFIRIGAGGGAAGPYSLNPGMVGEALAPFAGVQPTLPPGGKRPPLQSNTPCETQAPITSLNTPVGAGPTVVGPAGIGLPFGQTLGLPLPPGLSKSTGAAVQSTASATATKSVSGR